MCLFLVLSTFVASSHFSFCRFHSLSAQLCCAMASDLPSLDALLSPLRPAHLGLLTRCYLLSPPPVRCEEAQSLLRASFGLEVALNDIATVYTKLERDCPDFLGGARPASNTLVGELPFIEAAVSRCDNCEVALVPGKHGEAKAFLLDKWRHHQCPTCNLIFSNVWKSQPHARSRCCAVAAPEDAAFFQIVGCPRKTARRSLKRESFGCFGRQCCAAKLPSAASSRCSQTCMALLLIERMIATGLSTIGCCWRF